MDTVRSTLGPRGMDKLIFDGQKVIHVQSMINTTTADETTAVF